MSQLLRPVGLSISSRYFYLLVGDTLRDKIQLLKEIKLNKRRAFRIEVYSQVQKIYLNIQLFDSITESFSSG